MVSLSAQIDPIVNGYYEAIMLYATVIRRMHQQGANYTNGTNVAAAMKNTTFVSPINGATQIDAEGDRVMRYALKDLDTETGLYQVCLYCTSTVQVLYEYCSLITGVYLSLQVEVSSKRC